MILKSSMEKENNGKRWFISIDNSIRFSKKGITETRENPPPQKKRGIITLISNVIKSRQTKNLTKKNENNRFVYVICPFRTWMVMILYNFLSFITLSNFWPFTVSIYPCVVMYSHKLINNATHCFSFFLLSSIWPMIISELSFFIIFHQCMLSLSACIYKYLLNSYFSWNSLVTHMYLFCF